MFEDRLTLELTGTVTHFDYVIPHSWLHYMRPTCSVLDWQQ